MKQYIIYKKINEEEFDEIKSRLNLIEKISSPMMQMNSFYLNRIDYDEILALDYLQDRTEFYGNIGLTYDEENSTRELKLFRFYVIKSYDMKNQRFYKRAGVNKNYTLEDVERNFIRLFQDCLTLYKSFRKEDLIERIELRND